MAGLEAITTERPRGERLESRHNDLLEPIFGDRRFADLQAGGRLAAQLLLPRSTSAALGLNGRRVRLSSREATASW